MENAVQVPSGSEIQPPNEPPVETPTIPVEPLADDRVAYTSYQKLLVEKKKIQAENDKLRSDFEVKQRDELESQARFKELWESQKTENETLMGKVNSYETRWSDALKLDAFNQALGDTKRIDPKYSGFIDTQNILIDPETQAIDGLSAKREVDRVFKEFPEIFKTTMTTHMPNETPTPGTKGMLSKNEWNKLTSKEMIARKGEVDWSS